MFEENDRTNKYKYLFPTFSYNCGQDCGLTNCFSITFLFFIDRWINSCPNSAKFRILNFLLSKNHWIFVEYQKKLECNDLSNQGSLWWSKKASSPLIAVPEIDSGLNFCLIIFVLNCKSKLVLNRFLMSFIDLIPVILRNLVFNGCSLILPIFCLYNIFVNWGSTCLRIDVLRALTSQFSWNFQWNKRK